MWLPFLLLLGLASSGTCFPLLDWAFGLPATVKGILPATMADMVLPNGYPLEEHHVETQDGYILTVYRIPYGKKTTVLKSRPPLLLQHGVLCSSAAWVLSDPSKGLGYVLADAGYDVWMSNSRGNTYSMQHKTLDPSKDAEKFWNFSFHEMGYYDLPAVIDYMLDRTNSSQIYYVGHSQGTTQFFAMAASRPEYNAKVKVMSALAPIAFLDHTKGAVKILTTLSSILEWVANHLGIYHVLSDNWMLSLFDQTICRKNAMTRPLCDNLLFLIAGYDSQQLNTSLVPLIAEHTPAGASIKQLIHYAQLAHNGCKFRQYDYGKSDNMKLYNTQEPPDYDLSKITTPIMLHYSDNDWLAQPADVDVLFSKLPTSTKLEVPFAYFNHLDFMWAIDVNPLLYNKVIEKLKEY